VIPAAAELSRTQVDRLEKTLREIKGFACMARAKVASDR